MKIRRIGAFVALSTIGLLLPQATSLANDRRARPLVSVGDAQAVEGNQGRSFIQFAVTLASPSDRDVTVDWRTRRDTANPSDYVDSDGTVRIRRGQTTGVIEVAIIGDTTVEPDETFRVRLRNVEGARLDDREGVGTITNDDSPVTEVVLTSLAITAPPSLVKGTTAQATVEGIYSDGTRKPIVGAVWTATGGVSVDPTSGVVSATAEPLGVVTVGFDGKTASTTIAVTQAELVSLAVVASPSSLAKGRVGTVNTIGTYTDGSQSPVNATYTTTNGISIDGTTFSALAEGGQTVTASFGGQTATANVTVTAAELVSLQIAIANSVGPASIPLGRTAQATLRGVYTDGTRSITNGVTWSATSATQSLTISGAGLISTSSMGSGTVTATFGERSATINVNVTEPAFVQYMIYGPAEVIGEVPAQYTLVGTKSDGSTVDLTTTVNTWTVVLAAPDLDTGTIIANGTVGASTGLLRPVNPNLADGVLAVRVVIGDTELTTPVTVRPNLQGIQVFVQSAKTPPHPTTFTAALYAWLGLAKDVRFTVRGTLLNEVVVDVSEFATFDTLLPDNPTRISNDPATRGRIIFGAPYIPEAPLQPGNRVTVGAIQKDFAILVSSATLEMWMPIVGASKVEGTVNTYARTASIGSNLSFVGDPVERVSGVIYLFIPCPGQLMCDGLTVVSSNSDVARYDPNTGLVSVLQPGTAEISVYATSTAPGSQQTLIGITRLTVPTSST